MPVRGMTESERSLRDELLDVNERVHNAMDAKAPEAEIRKLVHRVGEIKDALVTMTGSSRSGNGEFRGGPRHQERERETGERALIGTDAPPEYRGDADAHSPHIIRANQSLSAFYEQLPAEIRNPSGLDMGSFDKDAFYRQLLTRNAGGREYRALSEGTQSVTATGGGFIVPIDFASGILELLRANLVFTSPGVDGVINGPQVVDMSHNVMYYPTWSQDGANTGQWVAENTQLTPGTPALGFAQLQANMNASVVLASRQILEDTNTSGGLAQLIETNLARAIARDLDSAALYGLGHGNGQPPGILTSNVSGLLIQSLGTNGAAPTSYSDISKAVEQVRNANDEPSGIFTNPKVLGTYGRLVDTLGQPMRPTPDMEAYWPPRFSTAFSASETQGSSSAASSALVLNANRVLFGLRRGLSFMILDQRWADFLQVGFVATVRCDWNYPYSNAACRVEGLLTT
jgi:HK97 family phage major capsid protein